MQSIDPPCPVLMQPMQSNNSPAEATQAPGAAPAAAPGGAPHDADTRGQASEGGAGGGGEEEHTRGDTPPGGSDSPAPASGDADAAGEGSALVGALDEGGPDFYDPAAWTQAAEFIVSVHKELPDELRTEALRSQQVASQLWSQAQGLLTGMCCPPGGELIQGEAPEAKDADDKAQAGR